MSSNQDSVGARFAKRGGLKRLSPNFSQSFDSDITCRNRRLSPARSVDGERSPRKRNAFSRDSSFNNENNEATDGVWELDSKGVFRQILQELYREQEMEKIKVAEDEVDQESKVDKRPNAKHEHTDKVIEEYKFTLFIRYMSTEHEYLLSFVIFLPLLVTTFYIMFIE